MLQCQALALIRTCQQAHEEGTNVLYGVNIFRFDDIPYDMTPTGYIGSRSAFILPQCEMTFLYAFLSHIGKANRLKMRHLRLEFFSDAFVTFPEGPGRYNIWQSYGKGGYGGAVYVSEALDLLTDSHRLQTLKVGFSGSEDGVAGFSIWFSMNSMLIRRLAQFKGIQRFECSLKNSVSLKLNKAKYAAFMNAVNNYQELKVKLATAYPLEEGPIDPSSARGGFQSDPALQV